MRVRKVLYDLSIRPASDCSVTNRGDNSAGLRICNLWGATAASDLKPGHPAPLHFRIGRDNSDRDYLADFRALGLLEVQPGNSLSSMFRMRSANRACEREKLEDFPAARGDSERKSASHAISYAKHFSRSHDAVIRVYDAAGNVIETYEHKGEFKEW